MELFAVSGNKKASAGSGLSPEGHEEQEAAKTALEPAISEPKAQPSQPSLVPLPSNMTTSCAWKSTRA